jgi:hypothetical protein
MSAIAGDQSSVISISAAGLVVRDQKPQSKAAAVLITDY